MRDEPCHKIGKPYKWRWKKLVKGVSLEAIKSSKMKSNLAQLIATRRSVFPEQYSEVPVSEETIKSLLEAANWAPTHKRTEPWRFHVFHSEDARTRLSQFFHEAYPKSVEKLSEIKMRKLVEKPLKAGCVIAICFSRDPKESLPEWEEVAATAMAVQNMWLMATDMGMGAYWSTPGLMNYYGDYFQLGEGERCLGFFYLGHYEGEPFQGIRNSSIEEKTTWI